MRVNSKCLDALRDLRLAKGITTKEVADALNLSAWSYHRKERDNLMLRSEFDNAMKYLFSQDSRYMMKEEAYFIRILRRRKGLSAKELGKKVGFSSSVIYDKEVGKVRMRKEDFSLFMQVLGE